MNQQPGPGQWHLVEIMHNPVRAEVFVRRIGFCRVVGWAA
jgi:hypothetical protein